MIRSMTGFGRGHSRSRYGKFTVEIRTYNHKFLETTSKLPNSLIVFEEKVKNILKNSLKRGKVYLNVVYEGLANETEGLLIDEPIAKRYYRQISLLKKHLGIPGELKISDILNFPGVLNYKTNEKNIAKLWPSLKEAIGKAAEKLIIDREREGKLLYKDFSSRLKKIKSIVDDIKENSVSNVDNYKRKLAARVKELSSSHSIDKGRLEMEVALFAKNCDISEEITRLKNHLLNFRKTLAKRQEAGKKLDFIAQELHREINTIGAKSSDFRISRGVIEVKTEIEKIREQLKNIE